MVAQNKQNIMQKPKVFKNFEGQKEKAFYFA